MNRIIRNPFLLRDWWVWRRRSSRLLGGTFPLFLLCVSAPIPLAWSAGGAVQDGWFVAFALWSVTLTLCAVVTGVHVYARERDLRTLDVVSITATRYDGEAWGRLLASLIPLHRGWLLGVVLVALAPLCLEGGSAREVARAALLHWLLMGVVMAGLAALGLAASAGSATAQAASTSTLIVLMSAPAVYGLTPQLIPILDRLGWPLVALPPSLAGPVMAFAAPRLYLVLFPAWAAFTVYCVWVVEYHLRKGTQLKASAAAPPEPQGLVPTAQSLTVFEPALPAPAPAWDRTRPRHSGVAEAVLRFARHNPFYEAWRGGFVRLFPGTAAPGSAIPPGILMAFLLIYPMLANDRASSTGGAWWLLTAIAIASFGGLLQGHFLGARALSAERDRDTWPLIVVTGMRPERILAGKFAASFYALSGEWTYTLPFWLLAAVLTMNPALPLLGLIQPLSIAAGVLLGLLVASQPRFLVINVPGVLLTLVVLSTAVVALHQVLAVVGRTFTLVPLLGIADIAANRPSASAILSAALALLPLAAAALLIWRWTAHRLRRVMQGE